VRCKHAHTHTRWLHLCVRWYDVEGRVQGVPLRDGTCRCERKGYVECANRGEV